MAMIDLAGRVAVVTGGTRGIGRAIAERLVDRGADVVVGSRSEEHVAEARQALAERGAGRALGVVCDVRNHGDCAHLIAAAVEAFGRLDVLINNAGIGVFKPVSEMTVDEWQAVVETNLNGLFYCTHAALPHLRKAGDAWVINIGSLAGKNAFPNGAVYNATKFGLIGFSEALMQEVRHDGIRVSYVMPGSVASEFAGHSGDQSWKIQPEDLAQIVEDLLSLDRRTLASRVEVRPSRPPKR